MLLVATLKYVGGGGGVSDHAPFGNFDKKMEV